MGFLPTAKGTRPGDFRYDDPLKPTFDPEAILIFDSGDIPVPDKYKNAENWVIQVKYQENEEDYVKVAKYLCSCYPNVNIMVTSAYQRLNNNQDNLPEMAALKHEPTHKIGISRAEPASSQPSS